MKSSPCLRALCDEISEALATSPIVEVDLQRVRDCGALIAEFQAMLRATIEYDYVLAPWDIIAHWEWPSRAFGTLKLHRNERISGDMLQQYRRQVPCESST